MAPCSNWLDRKERYGLCSNPNQSLSDDQRLQKKVWRNPNGHSTKPAIYAGANFIFFTYNKSCQALISKVDIRNELFCIADCDSENKIIRAKERVTDKTLKKSSSSINTGTKEMKESSPLHLFREISNELKLKPRT